MKVVLMGSFPVYDYADELGINPKAYERVTSWNENLANSLAQIPGIKVHFIAGTKLIKETRTVNRDNLSVTFFVSPPRANMLTIFQYTRWKIHKMLQDFQPDIVHGIGTAHIWPYIATTSPFPSVVTVHGVMTEIVKKLSPPLISRKRFFSLLERRVLRKTKFLISINPYVKSTLGSYTNAKIFTIENPIWKGFFDVNARPGDSESILFVGDIHHRKNVYNLIKVFAQVLQHHNQTKLVIVGSVTEENYCRKVKKLIQKKDLTDQVVFKGFLLPDKLAKEYKKAGLLVLPSLEETAPMCISEAMACGLPVVATRVGGVSYMVKEGETGFLVDPGANNDLADKLLTLLDSPDLRERMGDRGKEVAKQRWWPNKIAQETFDVYQVITQKL